MPSNWLYIDTNFPTFTGEEETEEKVSVIQNYLFMLVEQLRYSLHNLDSSNMNQTALGAFTRDLTEPLYARIEDAEGNLTELGITAKGIAARVSDAEGNISSLQMTATSLASQIQDANGNISILQQTATSLASQIRDANGNISILQQTATSLASQIQDANGNISTLQQTATSLASQIRDANGNISTLQQTATSLASQIQDANGNISVLQQTAAGLSSTVSSQAGQISAIQQSVNSIRLGVYNGDGYSTLSIYKDGIALSSQNIIFNGVVTFSDLSTAGRTTIYGGNILTDTLWLDSLYGNSIYLRNAYGQIGTEFRLGGASSAPDRCEMWTRAMFLYADQGDIYLTSNGGYVTLDAVYGITCHANVFPGRANYYDCGTFGFPWRDVYTQDGFVQSSDERGKAEIDYDMGRYSGLFDRLRPCSFLRKNGTSGRRHHGFIAQEVREALAAEGMTGKDFAGYVDWEDGGEYGFGLRYEEMIAMVVHEVQEVKKQSAEICKRLGI